MEQRDQDKKYESLEKKVLKKYRQREKKFKKPAMTMTGKSVFTLQKLSNNSFANRIKKAGNRLQQNSSHNS